MEGILLMLLFQVILIMLNAIFACAEIAVISVGDGKLEKLAEDGDKRAKKLLKLTSNNAKFLATIQVAITLAGFLGSAFAAEHFSGPIVEWLISLGVPISPSALDAAAVVCITLMLSFFTLVFGELVPKRLAMRNPEKKALGAAGLVTFLSRVFAPLVWLLTKSTNGVLRIMGIDPNDNGSDVSEEDIRVMVDSAAKSSSIDDEERTFIENIFEFDDLTAGDIATHRTDVELLWLEDSEEEWNTVIHDKCHMFYPVCGESVDDVVGVLYLKDYFRLGTTERGAVMENAVKKPYYVPESAKADVLFRNMKKNGRTFAVVLDEYGGMYGILTMNDLITRLVGELGDEADTEKTAATLSLTGELTWKLCGNVAIEDISEEMKLELPEDEFDTFSAMVFSEFGSIPDDGEKLEVEAWGMKVFVEKVEDHQIAEAVLVRSEPFEVDGDEESEKSENADE